MKTLLAFLLLCSSALAVDYPVVAVRSVRPDDTTLIRFPEIFNAVMHPPSDLVIRKPDGSVSVLVSGEGKDALFDPKPSLDGKWLYYVRIPDTKSRNSQRGTPVGAPYKGADIWRVEIATGKKVRVTGQHWTPPGSAADWSEDDIAGRRWWVDEKTRIGYGVANLGPCSLPGGRLAFTSNRRGYATPSGYSFPTTQHFILDDIPGETDHDGEAKRNVECTGFLNVSAALHPVLLTTGEILWASHESQGGRDRRLWSLWQSYPDGRKWNPVYSALSGVAGWHFHGQRSDGSLFSALYYNLNNNGFGGIYESPLTVEKPEYLSPVAKANPPVDNLMNAYKRYWFSTMRRGLYSVTPFCGPEDTAAAKDEDGNYMGKVTHPSAAPNNGMLVVYSPGPANNKNRPTDLPRYHMQVGLIKGKVAAKPSDIEILLKTDGYNYTQPVALVPWKQIYGSEPKEIPVLPNESGTPMGVVGSSSAHIGQWIPVDGSSRQGFQSSTKGNETDKPPAGIDVVALSPRVLKTYGPHKDTGWENAINERMHVLARVMLNESGRNGDSSWAAEIPADVPFTFRTFDEDGRTITLARTWHQVRPGEKRVDCGGCHNHSGIEVKWEDSWFVKTAQKPKPFDRSKVYTPEFNRDVLPIFKAKCWSCHGPDKNHPVKLDASIAKSDYVVRLKAFESRLSKAIHGEGNTAQMPLEAEPLTKAEGLKIDEWIDYGCLVAEPGKAEYDESPPTLFVSRSGTLKIGAYDYMSGLESVTATKDGAALTLTKSGNVWTGPALEAGDLVTVTARDKAGSETVIERFVRATEPVDETAELRTRIAALEAVVEQQKMAIEQLKKSIAAKAAVIEAVRKAVN